MPIHHMLYRCPRCGHDPLDGHERRARCSSCGTSFEQGRGSLIIVRPPDGPPEPTAASSLLADVGKKGGPGIKKDLGKDRGKDRGEDLSEESLFRESRVVFGRAEGHDVIRWRGEVLGFSERISWKGAGLLRLEGEALSFRPSGKGEGFSCLLGDIRGVQISSRALQVTQEDTHLCQFELLDDSPKRWEHLLCLALRRFYARSGQRVTEFKPRIITTPDRTTSDRNVRTETRMTETRMTDEERSMTLYRVLRWIMSVYFRARLKIRLEGEENVPDKGAFVLVLSHQSHLDSLLLHTFCPRLMFTLAKSSVFRTRFMAWLAPRVGAVPTRRYQIDPQAVRVALRLIGRGEGVGVFPEAERSWDGRLQPLRSGTIRLLLKAGVPVIPCGIVGTYEVFPRWGHMNWFKVGLGREPVIIRYREPIHFGKHDDRASREWARPDATVRMETALQAVMAQ